MPPRGGCFLAGRTLLIWPSIQSVHSARSWRFVERSMRNELIDVLAMVVSRPECATTAVLSCSSRASGETSATLPEAWRSGDAWTADMSERGQSVRADAATVGREAHTTRGQAGEAEGTHEH